MPEKKQIRINLIAGGVIALAVLFAYGGSLSAPFVFDSASIIAYNPTLRHLASALRPPHDGSTVDGRPLLNLSLAINYAISGTQVWSYHALNLLIHILAGFTLFGIVRRTLLQLAADGVFTLKRADAGDLPSRSMRKKKKSERMGERDAGPYFVAFATALLWTLHPLQTESVTYIVQRAESMMGLFYFLTLYCFIRGAEDTGESTDGRPARPRSTPVATLIWFGLSVLACLCGMATKEVMVSAPVVVFLYDRTFLSGSFAEAWRRRKRVFIALASTWILLAVLAIGSASRSGTAGLGVSLRWSDYAFTQVYAIGHYLQLALWPSPLVFDYGTAVVTQPSLVFPAAIVVTLLVVGTLVALVRRPILGFLGFWFLAILAPTSLVPVATQTIAEHRMYLPLAALAVLAALAIAHMPGKGGRAAVLALAAVLGMATARRNDAYASEETLWRDNIAKKPDDARAYNNLGNALYMMGRIPEAAEQYGHALQLQPDNNPEAQYNLGNCFLEENRLPEALSHFSEAVRLAPDNSGAHNNFGKALAESGRLPEAMVQFRDALQINPNDAEAHNNVGTLWYLMGRKPEAIAEYEEALRINPNFADARASLDHLQAGSK